MRLVCSLNDQQKAYTLSAYLLQQKIENRLELITNSDWSSPEYGTITCNIWVIDEDQLEQSQQIVEEFLRDPDNPRFLPPTETTAPFQDEPSPITMNPNAAAKTVEPLGIITGYILFICVIFLIISSLTSPAVKAIPQGLPYEPILFSPLNKALLYDYPKAYEIVDKLVETYGLDTLVTESPLPKGSQQLIDEFNHTPYWKGFYEKMVQHFRDPSSSWEITAPLFEKEREGELWRLLTPIFLHGDIFHLFFNMIWLIVLGKQMEQRLGKAKYILFIAIAALISNTAQYFMSGPNFLGFSGVLCAMLTFIWFRQRKAAWEGYLLEKSTMAFITFFIIFMFCLQVISFFFEAHENTNFSIGIANTAHLTGALVGYILSRFQFFAWR